MYFASPTWTGLRLLGTGRLGAGRLAAADYAPGLLCAETFRRQRQKNFFSKKNFFFSKNIFSTKKRFSTQKNFFSFK